MTILWVDDEIHHLKSHIRFLEKRGFRVLTASGGMEALDILRDNRVDLVLVDQMMVGMDGLETIARMRAHYHAIPVVMVTQSEEEELMDTAISGQVDDFLTKPVNPSQILLVVKKLLMGRRLKTRKAVREMVNSAARLMEMKSQGMDLDDWKDFYGSWVERDVAFDGDVADEMRSLDRQHFLEMEHDFSKFIEENYPKWIAMGTEEQPLMSHNLLEKVVVPLVRRSSELVLMVIDCMRFDQWLTMSSILEKWFYVENSFMLAVLPSATPYSRNSIFSGLLPRDIWRFHRRLWNEQIGDPGLNRHEGFFLGEALKRLGCERNVRPDYVKVSNRREGEMLLHSLSKYLRDGFLAIVVNYIDHLTHGRSELDLIRDLAPDVASFRKLAETWFRSSFLRELFHTLAARGTTVVVTSDHGSVCTARETRIHGRGVSGSIRFRFGVTVSADPKAVVITDDPAAWGLPNNRPGKKYLFARSDYFMMFPGMSREEMIKFRNTFQHGGTSMEEMLVPCVVMKPKAVK